jgi:lipoprotein-anchoring transpeptidase ErfK/SrfK
MPAGAYAAPAVASGRIAASQEVVTLRHAQAVFSRPDSAAEPVAHVEAARPITGGTTSLPVLRRSTDKRGTLWLRVRLPGRVVGEESPPAAGWIRATRMVLSTTPWHVVVKLGARRVVVYRSGRQVRSYSASVGKPSTPTPRGEYFVEENVRMPASAAGAPFALATSARSGVLQEFEGGPGQIALHGLGNIGGPIGAPVSHGCIRMTGRSIRWLAARIAPGAPVTIE